MRTWRAAAAVLPVVLSAVVLAGCGAGGADGSAPSPSSGGTSAGASPAAPTAPGPGSPTAPTPGATAPSTTATTAAPAPPSASERLVTVTRSGGIAGRTTSLLVKGDGSWTRLDDQARQVGAGKLSPEALARLRAALEAADFPHLPRVSRSSGTVFDGFTYAFVHGGFEVMVADPAIPRGLDGVLAALPPFETG